MFNQARDEETGVNVSVKGAKVAATGNAGNGNPAILIGVQVFNDIVYVGDALESYATPGHKWILEAAVDTTIEDIANAIAGKGMPVEDMCLVCEGKPIWIGSGMAPASGISHNEATSVGALLKAADAWQAKDENFDHWDILDLRFACFKGSAEGCKEWLAGQKEPVSLPDVPKRGAHQYSKWLPESVQWAISLCILFGAFIWVFTGNPVTGVMGQDGSHIDTWLVPMSIGVCGLICSAGYMSPTDMPNLIVNIVVISLLGIGAALFGSLGGLLPYTLGSSYMMAIWAYSSFHMALTCRAPAPKGVDGPLVRQTWTVASLVDFDFQTYRHYTTINGVLGAWVNAFTWVWAAKWGLPNFYRWLIGVCILPFLLFAIGIIKQVRKGSNGQYFVDLATFIRVGIAGRFGAYFCFGYFVIYNLEQSITQEIILKNCDSGPGVPFSYISSP